MKACSMHILNQIRKNHAINRLYESLEPIETDYS
jgi:hypothetical protein